MYVCVCVRICEGKTAETIFLATFYVVLLAAAAGKLPGSPSCIEN